MFAKFFRTRVKVNLKLVSIAINVTYSLYLTIECRSLLNKSPPYDLRSNYKLVDLRKYIWDM